MFDRALSDSGQAARSPIPSVHLEYVRDVQAPTS